MFIVITAVYGGRKLTSDTSGAEPDLINTLWFVHHNLLPRRRAVKRESCAIAEWKEALQLELALLFCPFGPAVTNVVTSFRFAGFLSPYICFNLWVDFCLSYQ